MTESFWDKIEHRNDDIKYVGYDFRGNVFKRTLSPLFFGEKNREDMVQQLDGVMSYLIDYIKHIKKAYNWTLGKKYRDFN